jgi:hypothetical protein
MSKPSRRNNRMQCSVFSQACSLKTGHWSLNAEHWRLYDHSLFRFAYPA